MPVLVLVLFVALPVLCPRLSCVVAVILAVSVTEIVPRGQLPP